MMLSDTVSPLPVRQFFSRLNRINPVTKFLVLFALICCYYLHAFWPDRYVHFVVCDVGQGDAILIHQGFYQVLIDSSQDDRVLDCLDRNLPPWDRELEVVIVTHYDRDHVGGLASVLAVYRVNAVFASAWPDDFPAKYPGTIAATQSAVQQGLTWKQPILGPLIRWVQNSIPVSLELVQALPGESAWQAKQMHVPSSSWSSNDQSLILLLKVGSVSMLLTGDLEIAGERELIKSGRLSTVDVLKVGHHGAKTSTSAQFLAVTQPKLAVISVGKTNTYGHPAPETLERLRQFGVQTLSTSDVGDITIVSDGKRYW